MFSFKSNVLAVVLVAFISCISARATSVNLNYDNGHTGFGYSFGTSGGKGLADNFYADAYFWSEKSQIQYGSVAVNHRYTWDPETGEDISDPRDARIEISFGGLAIPPTQAQDYNSAQLTISDPPLSLYETVGSQVYDRSSPTGPGLTPLLVSSSNGHIEGNFTIDGSGYGSYLRFYDEWSEQYRFNAWMNLPIKLPAGVSVGSIPAMSFGTVPEPASLTSLALGAIFAIRRRR